MRKLGVFVMFVVMTAAWSEAAVAQGKITQDPNTLPPPPPSVELRDERLAGRITCRVERKTVADLLAQLTEGTHIVFRAGSDTDDWRVREMKVDVFAKEVTLSDLMNSIARATKLTWRRGGDEGHWTYRLYMDKKTTDAAEALREKQEGDADQKLADARAKMVSDLGSIDKLSSKDLENLKEDNPLMLHGRDLRPWISAD